MFNNPNESDKEKQDRSTGRFGQRLGCSSSILWIALLLLLVPWLWSLINGSNSPATKISYSEFRQQLESGNVKQITVQGDQIQGLLKTPAKVTGSNAAAQQFTEFTTFLPSFGDDQLFPLLQKNNVVVQTEPPQSFSWFELLIYALPFLLLFGLGYFFLQRMRTQGQSLFSMGRSRARLYDRKKEHTTFGDVAGNHGAKRELEEIISFLRSPERFERLGGQIPKGVLLVGPPGTGKTLLARAVAGEADAPFFSITGSDFMEMFVGVGASRVRDLFKEAKDAAPSIIFIDELDSIGRRRGAGIGGGHDEREQTLNQLLSELDGFEPNQNVIVMAATNRPDVLDSALLRPGRFDRQVSVDLPTMIDRLEILKIHSRNKPLAENVDLESIARSTPGFSGADLANLLNEAALLAAREEKDVIEQVDIENSYDKVLMGLERENLVLTDEECRLLAYHESGHAVVAAELPHADPIHKVTIVPRGRAMGVTQQLPERDRYLYPRDYIMDRLAVMMGGRASEELIFNTITSGAENDLKQATQLVRKMILDWGMSKSLGHVALGDSDGEVFLGQDLAERRAYSEITAREVDEEVKATLEEAFARATDVLKDHREGLDRVAEALLDKEEIPGSLVLEILGAEKPVEAKPLGQIQDRE